MLGNSKDILIIKSGERKNISSTKTVLLYCLRGTIEMNLNDRFVKFYERDILVVNQGDKYGFSTSNDSLLLKISVEDYQLRKVLKNKDGYIVLSSAEHKTRDYNSIRFILDSIVKQISRDENSFAIRSLYYMLWNKILEDYYVNNFHENKDEENKKYMEVCSYIYDHFNDSLYLKDISEKFGYTASTFSRWFKKNSGYKYVDFLRRLRLDHAKALLSETDYSIADIAFQTGFANLSVFNRNFLEYFGIQPSKYRHKQHEEVESIVDSAEIKKFVDETLVRDSSSLRKEIEININAKNTIAVHGNNLDIIGSIKPKDLMTGHIQRAIESIKDELHIKYIMVSDVMELVFDDNTEKTSFEKICLIVQIILDQMHLLPIFEISKLGLWKELLKYLELRYTKDTLSKFVFKINDSTLYSDREFCELFFNISREIKSVLPNAKIGIGHILLSNNYSRTKQMLRDFKERRISFDFVSVNPISSACKEYKTINYTENQHFLREKIEIFDKLTADLGISTKIWVEDLDSNLVVGDAYNDSCARACHLLMQVVDSVEKLDHVCISRITDWLYITEKYPYPIFGGGGILSKDSLKKPVYYALMMYGFSTNYCIAKGDGFYITRTVDDYYCIVLFNPQKFNSVYFQHEGQVRPEMMDYIFEDNKSITYKLNFVNIKNGTYNAASYEIISDKNNLLIEWKNLEYKPILNTGEIEYLNSAVNPKLTYKSEKISNNILSLKYTLGPSDFRLVLFTPT